MEIRVRDVMVPKVDGASPAVPAAPAIEADRPLIEAARRMLTEQVRVLLVIEAGEIIGWLSSTDLLRAVWSA